MASWSSPTSRPPASVRGVIAAFAVVAALLTVLLMLADRAPDLLSSAFGDDARRLWARLDESGRTDFITGGERPAADVMVHVVVWASVTGLTSLAIWSWRWLGAIAAGCFGASIMVEIAQELWSSTREIERSDVVANALGVALGSGAAALLFAVWAAGAATFARRRSR